MSFFKRDEEPDATQPARRPASPSMPSAATGSGAAQQVTRIAGGTRVTGEISGGTDLLIEGEVDGRLRLDSRVVVGQAGGLKGEIHARSVRIDGRVEGPVRGSERVEVGPTGRLEGDIRAPRVTIAEGAFFKGKVEMGGDDRRSGSSAGSGSRGGTDRGRAKGDEDDAPGLFPGGPEASGGSAGASGTTGAAAATSRTGEQSGTDGKSGTDEKSGAGEKGAAGGKGATGSEGESGRGGRE